MRVTNLIKAKSPRQAGINLACKNQLVHRFGLHIICQMRTLQTLLHHPMITQIHGNVIAGGAGTNDHHAARFTDKTRGWQSGFTGMLEHDLRVLALANSFPDGFTKAAHAAHPGFILW